MAKRATRESGFIGIDAVIFGAQDMAQARKLFADFGLAKKQDTKSRLVFATEIGSEIVIRPSGAKDLPPPINPGAEFREVIWGVKSAKDVARIAADLARDRDVRRDRDGTIHAVDDAGIAFGVRVWRHRTEPKRAAALPLNAPGARHRVDAPSPMYERAKPFRIGHIVFNVPDVPEGRALLHQAPRLLALRPLCRRRGDLPALGGALRSPQSFHVPPAEPDRRSASPRFRGA